MLTSLIRLIIPGEVEGGNQFVKLYSRPGSGSLPRLLPYNEMNMIRRLTFSFALLLLAVKLLIQLSVGEYKFSICKQH